MRRQRSFHDCTIRIFNPTFHTIFLQHSLLLFPSLNPICQYGAVNNKITWHISTGVARLWSKTDLRLTRQLTIHVQLAVSCVWDLFNSMPATKLSGRRTNFLRGYLSVMCEAWTVLSEVYVKFGNDTLAIDLLLYYHAIKWARVVNAISCWGKWGISVNLTFIIKQVGYRNFTFNA